MYLRSFKQLLRAADPSFDEQAFGFASVYDLVRQAQREGLLRIERNRKGILRIFPGDNFPQATLQEPVQQEQPAAPVEAQEPESIEPAVEEAPSEPAPEVTVEPVSPPSVWEPAPEPPRKPKAPRARKGASARQPKQRKSAAPRKSRPKKSTETESIPF